MKRTLVAILAIIYFCVSSGFVVSSRYCMCKVSKVNVEIVPSKTCCCSTKQTKSCCKTESKFIKLSDNHQAAYADVSIVKPFQIITTFYTISNTSIASTKTILAFNSRSPPIISPQPIYILNCIFRI